MGSLVEDPNNAIDASVGGLVWVRRRNGSWWPGRILGPDELPKASVSKPRLGTPVKLLGREDASVDWYNLEKSKRVKAFRCGEYDDCINKAKISASLSSKKAVKYARREDAILHALELETARLGKDYPNLPNTQDEEQNHVHEEETKSLDENSSNSKDESNELSHSVVSFEEIKEEEHSRRLRRTPNDSEDDATEGVKRMRGLEDLGVGVSSSLLKRKRSQVNESLKKKNRRRTLSKVLECSSAMVSVPVVCEQISSPIELESNESKMNNSTVMNNNNSDSTGVSMHDAGEYASPGCKQKENEISSVQDIPENGFMGRLFDVPLVAEEKQSSGFATNVSCTSHRIPAQSSQSSHIKTLNKSISTSSATTDVHNISQMIEKGTSEWQLKGKRNSRPRKTDTDDEMLDSNRIGRPLISEVSASYLLKSRQMVGGWKSSHTRGSMADTVRSRTVNPKFDFSPAHHRTIGSRMHDVKVEVEMNHRTVNPKFDFSPAHHHTIFSRMHDVKVEVEMNHRPQHVPYISMQSKLYGLAIIGHPISIEGLNDGSCDDLLLECYSSSSEVEYSNKIGSGPAFCGRPPRRNGLLSKKTRKLSSLTGSRLQKQESMKRGVEPSIACVSLKAVFGRINGALHI